MLVVKCEPNKEAYIKVIGDTLEDLQAEVGGYIEVLYPYDDPVVLVCNEEGKLNGSKINRPLYDEDGRLYDVIYGDCFVCGAGIEDFESLPTDLLIKYTQLLRKPLKAVYRLGSSGEIIAVD